MIAWACACALALAAALIVFLLVLDGPIVSLWRKQCNHFARYFSLLFIDRRPERAAALHICVCAGALVAAALLSSLSLALLVPVLVALPSIQLERRLTRKRALLSEQLAPWLTILSNSLKSAPNISDAFEASVPLVSSPLREEIELLIKEVKLGEHLDRAMRCSAVRVRSPLYSSVITTLLVARQSGGNLPKILAGSSSTLREMDRLEGVVRTKTAEGKSQTFVLALLPFVVVAALNKVDPTMMSGLVAVKTGKIIVGVSIALWAGSVALARRIVKVDI